MDKDTSFPNTFHDPRKPRILENKAEELLIPWLFRSQGLIE